MKSPSAAPFVLAACLVGVAGCGQRDPYMRTDVWRPTGANAANIAAMVANPHDLIAGRGVARQDTKASELAVEHIWSGQSQSLSGGATAGSSSAPPPGGTGSGAGGTQSQ